MSSFEIQIVLLLGVCAFCEVVRLILALWSKLKGVINGRSDK